MKNKAIKEKVLNEIKKDKQFLKEIATEHDLDWNGKLMLRIVKEAIDLTIQEKDKTIKELELEIKRLKLKNDKKY